MNSVVKVNSFPLVSLFLQVSAGSEMSIVDDLGRKKYKSVYKILGQHDLLVLFNVDNLESEDIYYSCKGVHVAKSIASYSLSFEEYQSPNDISAWLAGSPLIGFVFLEMDKLFYSPDEAAKSSLNAYSLIIESLVSYGEKNKIELAVFGGYGKSDFYLIVKAKSIEEIWNTAHHCRSLRSLDVFGDGDGLANERHISIFTNTTSIPCISYDNINYDPGIIEVSGIEGSCSASILINCPSGYEHKVYGRFDSNKFNIHGQLGSSDCVAFTKAPIESKELIETVLGFRHEWFTEYGVEIATQTIIHDEAPVNIEKTVTNYRVDRKFPTWNISKQLKKSNLLLANRIDNFVHTVNSYNQNRSHQILVHSIEPYVEVLLDAMFDYDSLEVKEKHGQEGILLQAIEAAENGLSQRIGSNFDNIYGSNQSLPLPFGDGIFSNLTAINNMISHIFSAWVKSNEGEHETLGFPTFNDALGYQMGYGEIFNVPLKALYDPCDNSVNWLTLTHEISHAIYLRLHIDYYDEETLEIVESLLPRAPKDVVSDEAYELFAHWFDFYHFYDEKINDYLRGVWGSWLGIPVVHINIEEYLFRSVFIYFCYKNDEVLASMTPNAMETIADCSARLWEEHAILLKEHFKEFSSYSDTLDEMRKEGAIELISRQNELVGLFNKYKKNDFRNELNRPYDLINDHVKAIQNGELVEGKIDNSYLLIKRIILNNYENHNCLHISTALILSLKNTTYFYVSPDNEKN